MSTSSDAAQPDDALPAARAPVSNRAVANRLRDANAQQGLRLDPSSLAAFDPVLRQAAGAPGVASPPVTSADPSVRADLEAMRARSLVRQARLQAFLTGGFQTTTTIRDRLLQVTITYEKAYAQHAAAVGKGAAEAQNQTDWANIFVGIGVGTVIGLVPELAVAAELSLGATVALGMATEGVEALVGGVIGATKVTEFAGRDAVAAKLPPHELKIDAYTSVERLRAAVAGMSESVWPLFLLHGATEYAIGEARIQARGGGGDMSVLDLIGLIEHLRRADAAGARLDQALATAQARLAAAAEATAATPDYDERRMLQDIWIMWVSELPDDKHNTLDLDEIEGPLLAVGVLGPGGRLGVDFGWYTSEEDELRALRAARAVAAQIRERYKAISKVGR